MVLSVAAAGVLLATIDASIVNVALPTISSFFNVSVRTTAWVTISYMLVITALLLIFGRLSDMYGCKLIFVSGMAIFTVASGLCAMSGGIEYLIAFRALQGFGAAMIMSNTPSIVTGAFPPEQRGMGLGVIGSVVSVGLMLGPPLGGMIIHYLGWKFIFFVNIPVGIGGIILSLKILSPNTAMKKTKLRPVDSILWIMGITAYVFVFGIMGKSGFSFFPNGAFLAIATVVLIMFFLRQFKTDHPLFSPELLKNKIFIFSCGAGFFIYMGIMGVSFMFPFFLERSIGLDPLSTGRFLMVIPATTVIVSPLSGTLSDKFGQRPIATIGTTITAISIFSLLSLNQDSSAIRIILNLIGMGVGIGMFSSPNNSALMGSVDNSNRGSAAGILATVRNLGFVTGAAVVSFAFNSELNKEIIPESLNYAAAFNDTLPLAFIFVLAAMVFSVLRRSV